MSIHACIHGSSPGVDDDACTSPTVRISLSYKLYAMTSSVPVTQKTGQMPTVY